MRYLSVCSGIEAATVAWHPIGWTPFAFSEIEPFPSSVLADHYPSVKNLGDMTKFKEWPDATIDLLVGGTPCQSFSVAGLRKGLDDPRGNLMLTYGAIAARYRPKWLVWENVPGVLSSNGGRDFGTFLGMLGQLGYGFAYRVLDAQFFGVAQRRRRVFVVGCLGDWRRAAAVLFERHSLQGHPAPSREAGKNIDPCLDVRAGRSGETTFHTGGGLVPSVARCVTTGEAKRQDYETCTLIAHSLRGEGFDAGEDGTGRGTPLVPVAHVDTMPTLRAAAAQNGPGHGARSGDSKDEYIVPVSYGIDYEYNAHSLDDATGPLLKGSSSGGGHPLPAIAVSLRGREGGATAELGGEVGQCLRASKGGGDKPHVLESSKVRRLTPVECERLQGFPDNYTNIIIRGKPAADGPRYKALGNSMAVPCMAWIGRRIAAIEELRISQVAA